MMPMVDREAPQERTFTAGLDCHYLVSAPAGRAADPWLIVALHGYGSTPEVILRLAQSAVDPGNVIAAVEGPYQFHTSEKEIGFCWITRRHPASSVRLHHEMVLHVLGEAGREYGIPPERRLLLGFSQPVGLNYRFAATHPEAVRGVVGICGGLPSNWEEGPYRPVKAALLHIARRQDEIYTPEVTGRYAERLRLRAADVEFHMLEGGHRFPSQAKPVLNSWLGRLR